MGLEVSKRGVQGGQWAPTTRTLGADRVGAGCKKLIGAIEQIPTARGPRFSQD